MTDDIVTRLREYVPATCSACDTWSGCGYGEACDCTCHVHPYREAADEIERLRKDYDRLSNAAQKLAACISEDSHGYGCLGYKFDGWCTCEVGEALKAVRGD